MKKLIMIIMFVVGISYGQTNEMQKDINEIKIGIAELRVEMRSMQKQIEQNQLNAQKQMDDQRNLMYILISSIFGLTGIMMGLFGFVLWDRKTTLAPFKEEIRDNKKAFIEELKTYKEAFAAIAKIEPKFRDAMHKIGML